MSPASLQRFNTRKNALLRKLYPCIIEFDAAKKQLVDAAFGTFRTEGQPTAYGGTEYHREGFRAAHKQQLAHAPS